MAEEGIKLSEKPIVSATNLDFNFVIVDVNGNVRQATALDVREAVIAGPPVSSDPLYTAAFSGASLPSGLSLTRAGPKTYLDVNGIRQEALANVAAFTYSYDGQEYGLSIEPETENLLPYSIGLTTGWDVTAGLGNAKTVNAAPDRAGNSVAAMVTLNAAPVDGVSEITNTAGVTLTTGRYHALAVDLQGVVGGEQVYLYATNGTIYKTYGPISLTTRIERYSLYIGSPASTGSWRVCVGNDLRDPAQYILPGLRQFYASAIQCEYWPLPYGGLPTSYIPTAATAVTRYADVVEFTGTAKDVLRLPIGSIKIDAIRNCGDFGIGAQLVCGGTNGALSIGDTTAGANGSIGLYNIGNALVADEGMFLPNGGAGGQIGTGISQPLAVRWKAGDYGWSMNGAPTKVGTYGVAPVPADQYWLGSLNGTYVCGGIFKSITMWGIPLDNAALQAESRPLDYANPETTPPAALRAGYTKKIFDIVPTLSMVAPNNTDSNYEFTSRMFYDGTTVDLSGYSDIPGGGVNIPLGWGLITQGHDSKQARLPYLDASVGFYADFEMKVSDFNADHWPAVWQMPWEHDLAQTDRYKLLYPSEPASANYERWLEIDTDDGINNKMINASIYWEGTFGVGGYWRDPPTNTVGPADTTNAQKNGRIDKTVWHSYGMEFDPRDLTIRYYLNNRLVTTFSYAAGDYVNEIARLHHYYLIATTQSQGANVPYTMSIRRMRAYQPEPVGAVAGGRILKMDLQNDVYEAQGVTYGSIAALCTETGITDNRGASHGLQTDGFFPAKNSYNLLGKKGKGDAVGDWLATASGAVTVSGGRINVDENGSLNGVVHPLPLELGKAYMFGADRMPGSNGYDNYINLAGTGIGGSKGGGLPDRKQLIAGGFTDVGGYVTPTRVLGYAGMSTTGGGAGTINVIDNFFVQEAIPLKGMLSSQFRALIKAQAPASFGTRYPLFVAGDNQGADCYMELYVATDGHLHFRNRFYYNDQLDLDLGLLTVDANFQVEIKKGADTLSVKLDSNAQKNFGILPYAGIARFFFGVDKDTNVAYPSGRLQSVEIFAEGAPPAPLLVCHGDSLSTGTGATGNFGYTGRSARALNRRERGYGEGGRPMDWIADRVRDTVHTEYYAENPIFVMEGGFNNTGGATPDGALGDVARGISYLPPGAKYIVLSIPISDGFTPGAAPRIFADAFNASLASTYGTRYLDINPPLLAGSTGAGADLTDVANGIVPTSCRSDNVHWNDKGHQIVADAIVAKLVALGWA